MAIPKFDKDVKIHQGLSDQPNDIDGYTAEQLKQLYDQAAVWLQEWINDTLLPNLTAENIGFAATGGVNASNLQDAVTNVQQQAAGSVAGSIPNGSLTKDKLAEALLARIYGGKAWVSLEEPAAADNVAADFPVGQLWLRPAFTMVHRGLTGWTAAGCSVDAVDGGWKVTGSGSQQAVTVSQTMANIGEAGQRVIVNLAIEELDANASGVTVTLNGSAFAMTAGGRYEAVLDGGGGLTVAVTCTWPAAALAAGSFKITKYAVVNVGAIEAAAVGSHVRSDWPEYVAAHAPFASYYTPRQVWIQDNDGQWYPVMFETLPVDRGGTGVAALTPNTMLGADAHGAIRFMGVEDAVAFLGALRMETGSYTGNGAARSLELPVTKEPKLLYVYSAAGAYIDTSVQTSYGVIIPTDNPVLFAQGTKVADNRTVSYYVPSNGSIGHMLHGAYAKLSGKILTFSADAKSGYMNATPAASVCNASGVTYNWIALY